MEIIREEDNQKNPKGYLALPFDNNQFKKFITGLLGKPQSLQRNVHGNFNIYLKDIQNYHDLIDQRINQQNNGKLVQFKAQIYFSDDSSVTLGSYSELITYNELRPLRTSAILISWIYLIQFADKDVPEKQEIDILISTNRFKGELPNSISNPEYYDRNSINIHISHTARTWGYDILQMLSSNTRSLVKKEKSIILLLRAHDEFIIISSFILFCLSSLIGVYFFTSKYIESKTIIAKEFIKTTSNDSLKIDYLINELAIPNYINIKSLTFIGVAFVLSLIMTLLMSKFINIYSRSYIILTKSDNDSLILNEKDERNKLRFFIGSILLGILINIVSSLIYNYWL